MKYNIFKSSSLILCLIFIVNAGAQINYSDFITSGEQDAYYKPAVRERQAIPLHALREADVKYSKRVIRCIDTRQKFNKAIDWPRQPLKSVLYDALWEGSITPYKNDSLFSFYTSYEFHRRGGYEQIIQVCTDPNDITYCHDSLIWVDFDPIKIQKFWVIEDWVFDSKHSVFKPRIIAIAPIYKPQFEFFEGPEQPLCWIPMDDKLRHLLSRTEMFNRYNQAARMSFDDLFQMRLFDSYIVYESNVFDNFISYFEAYENDPIGALLESDRIKNDLFIIEHDFWQF